MSGQLPCASGRDLGVVLSHLTIEIVRMLLNMGDTWTTISDRTLGLVCPVDLTREFDQTELGCSESPMALFRGGFYLSPMASSSSLSWPFSLT